MIVLHAGMGEDSFLLWAETQPHSVTARKSPRSMVRVSPFDVSEQSFVRLAGELGLSEADRVQRAVAVLPSHRGKPIPSSPLIDEDIDPGVRGFLETWQISAIPLTAEQAISFLTSVQERHLLRPGVVIGDDLIYWHRLLLFTYRLVYKQRFLPGLKTAGDSWQSIWEPVIAGDDLDEFTHIASSAPHVTRAVMEKRTKDGSEPGSIVVSHSFVSFILDYLVRSTGAGATASSAPSTVYDAWLLGLTSPVPDINYNADELDKLQSALARWKRTITRTIAAPFRLCFRLEEPYDDLLFEESDLPIQGLQVTEAPWKISYLLQSTADPSLLIDASRVWSGQNLPSFLEDTRADAREYLLASLGTASMIYPPVDRSLLSATPTGVEIDLKEAHRFLTSRSGMLQQAGFGVILPSWWTRKKRKRLKAKAAVKKFQSKGNLSLDKLVEFQWELALGEQKITRKELEELVHLKEPLVRLRGMWIELDPEQLKAAMEFLKTGQQTLTIRQLIRLALGAQNLPSDLEFEGVVGNAVLEEFLDNLTNGESALPVVPSEKFTGTLRPYQSRGLSWLDFLTKWQLGACLADDMGLGKTIQTLALIQKRWNDSPESERRPVLLICPMSVVGNWRKEAEKFTPDLPILVHHGATRKKGEHFWEDAPQNALVLSSYTLLAKDFQQLQKVDWAGVILDEAQNIKNASTKQAKAARAVPGQYKIALTGTPVENNVGDLWSIMEFLNPGMLGNPTQFKRTFMTPIQVGRDAEAMERLKKITAPFVLRRLKTDKSVISDLPDKLEMKVFCNLTREQASLYSAVVKDLERKLKYVEGIERRGLVLATITKVKQVCNHPAHFLQDNSAIAGRSGKLSRLTEMLDEALQAGDKALIFSQYAEMGGILKVHLQETFGVEALFLHGGVSKTKRERMVSRFQEEPNGPQLFILSLKAGGVGLNLTQANHVFHFDRWWNPAVENQATDRAFRIGQTKSVQVHKFVCTGTMEERIDQLIEQKKELALQLIGAGENWITELNNQQLRELFALAKDAVAE